MERAVYAERDPRRSMSEADVAELLAVLDRAGVDVWLDGGWGVDALLGEQTREHDDLDLVCSLDDLPALISALESLGYEVAKGEPPLSVVLLDPEGRQVDVHPVRFTEAGDGIYRMEAGRDWAYPGAGFAGRGEIVDRSVRCLTPEVQVLCHAGYELGDTDHHDLALLRDRFDHV